jgi:antitoxin PrlF
MGAKKLSASSLTSKYQATIPAEVRKILGLRAGDKIEFEVSAQGEVVIRRISEQDFAYLKAVSETLSEWDSLADEEAFRDL